MWPSRPWHTRDRRDAALTTAWDDSQRTHEAVQRCPGMLAELAGADQPATPVVCDETAAAAERLITLHSGGA